MPKFLKVLLIGALGGALSAGKGVATNDSGTKSDVIVAAVATAIAAAISTDKKKGDDD